MVKYHHGWFVAAHLLAVVLGIFYRNILIFEFQLPIVLHVLSIIIFYDFLTLILWHFSTLADSSFIRKTVLLATAIFTISIFNPLNNSHNHKYFKQTNQYVHDNFFVKSVSPSGSRRTKLIIEDSFGNNYQISSWNSSFVGIEACDMIATKIYLNELRDRELPFGINMQQIAKSKGIKGYGWTVSESKIIKKNVNDLACKIEQARFSIYQKISKHMNFESSIALASALLVGYRDAIERVELNKYYLTGAGHLLAISGLHIGLIAIIIYNIVRFLQVLFIPQSRFVDNRLFAAIMMCIITLFYIFLAGLSISTIRAYIMLTVMSYAIVRYKTNRAFFSLIWSGVIILLLMPNQLYSAGFQLSFLAVLGLVSFWQNILLVSFKKNKKNFIHRYLINYFKLVIAIEIFVSPISMYYFGYYSTASFIINLVFIPFISVIILPMLFLGLLIPILWQLVDALLLYSSMFLNLLNSKVQAIYLAVPNGWFLVLYYLLVIITLLNINLFKAHAKKRYYLLLSSVFIFLFTSLFVHSYYQKVSRKDTIIISQYLGIFWQEQNGLYYHSFSGKNLSNFYISQIVKYYGLPPVATKAKAVDMENYQQVVSSKFNMVLHNHSGYKVGSCPKEQLADVIIADWASDCTKSDKIVDILDFAQSNYIIVRP